MYLVDPLKKSLPAVVDFNLINSGKTRFIDHAGCVAARGAERIAPRPTRDALS